MRKDQHSLEDLLGAGYEIWLTHIDSTVSARKVNNWLRDMGFLKTLKEMADEERRQEWPQRKRQVKLKQKTRDL